MKTLSYSDWLKEKTKQHFGENCNNINAGSRGINSGINNFAPIPKNIIQSDNKITYNKNLGNQKQIYGKKTKVERTESLNKRQKPTNKNNF